MTRRNNQHTVYENGIVLGASGDRIAAEEGIHIALSQHPAPKNILMVGGAINGMLSEAAKYNPDRVDYLELDPAILALTRQLSPELANGPFRYIAEDPRQFIRANTQQYDAILLNTADPTTSQINRLYTLEFFQLTSQALKKGGIIGFSLSGSENYLNPEMRALIATTHHTLAQVFDNVLVVPGSRHYFMAGNLKLDYAISARLKEKQIATSYINEAYLKARLTSDRLVAVQQLLEVAAPLNRDFKPVAYLQALKYWLAHFQESLLLPLLVIGILLLISIALFSQGPRPQANSALFCSGFTGMGLEIVILIVFQICQGVVYQQVGLIFTAFLIGTASGALWAVRSNAPLLKLMLGLDIAHALTAFTMAGILYFFGSTLAGLPRGSLLVVLPGLTALIGFLVGGQLPAAAGLNFSGLERTAARLYSLDYFGSALGALMITIFCIPRFGLSATCLGLGLVKCASSTWLLVGKSVPDPARVPQPRPRDHWQAPIACLLLFAGTGILISNNATSAALYAFSFETAYHWLLLILLLGGLAYATMNLLPGLPSPGQTGPWPSFDKMIYKLHQLSLFRMVCFLAFGLTIFFPIFRCYFKIPYLFCHVCPRRCVFGFFRPYLIPAALIMNLQRRFWCFQACPLGTLLDTQAKIGAKPLNISKVFTLLPLAILGFTAYSYFRIQEDLNRMPDSSTTDWYTLFFNNAFIPSATVIIVAVILVIGALVIRRSFCDYLCPVGTVSRIIGKVEKMVVNER